MADQLSELRAILQARIKTEDPQFHPADEARLESDEYLKRFLLHQENVLKDAVEMAWDALTWRKNVGASNINETNINMEYINEGAFFPNGRDVDGKLILVFKAKMHVKGTKDFEELKKCIIYWFDRIERMERGQQITLFFDMEGCGLSNMDMEFTKYLIALVKLYYPYMLNYIIIFEMPWVLSAAFKIIKQLLPAKAVSKMKFVTRSTLNEFVAAEEALVQWGGTNEYRFTFVPESKDDASPDQTPKKVTFAEQGDGHHSPGEMLRINPNETIVFKSENEEVIGQFTLTNMEDGVVSFKIRTNSPEKFRVRPSTGILARGASQTVTIVLQPGFQVKTLGKDRFLVLSVQIPQATLTTEEIAEIWKNSSGSKVDEYRLKCSCPGEKERNGILQVSDDKQMLAASLKELKRSVATIEAQVSMIRMLQFATLFLICICIGLCIVFIPRPDKGHCYKQ